MTHEQLVHETAEKMARLSYSSFERSSPTMQSDFIMRMYTCAELAVAMKAEGFDEGYRSIHWSKRKHDLGLTKPTDNETIS